MHKKSFYSPEMAVLGLSVVGTVDDPKACANLVKKRSCPCATNVVVRLYLLLCIMCSNGAVMQWFCALIFTFYFFCGAFSAEKCLCLCDFAKGPYDKDLFSVMSEKFGFYGRGAVWAAPCELADGQPSQWCVYYRPERAMWDKVGREQCYKLCVDEESSKIWPKDLQIMFPFLRKITVSPDNPLFTHPRCDVACAAISGIKALCSGQPCIFDGLLNPDFSSWAQYTPRCERQETDICLLQSICGETYTKGDVWIRREGDRSILCYKSDYSYDWVCYRYDLSHSSLWPQCWLKELRFLRGLESHPQEQECPAFSLEHIVAVVKATLSGRGARFDEFLWFAWKPQCSDDILWMANDDILLRGSIDHGVYTKGSVWMVRAPARSRLALRYRSPQNDVFQLTDTLCSPQGCGVLPRLMQYMGQTWRFLIDVFIYQNTEEGCVIAPNKQKLEMVMALDKRGVKPANDLSLL